MPTVDGLRKTRALAAEAATIVDARLESDSLILTTHGGADINVGNVKGSDGTDGNPYIYSIGILNGTDEAAGFVAGTTLAALTGAGTLSFVLNNPGINPLPVRFIVKGNVLSGAGTNTQLGVRLTGATVVTLDADVADVAKVGPSLDVNVLALIDLTLNPGDTTVQLAGRGATTSRVRRASITVEKRSIAA